MEQKANDIRGFWASEPVFSHGDGSAVAQNCCRCLGSISEIAILWVVRYAKHAKCDCPGSCALVQCGYFRKLLNLRFGEQQPGPLKGRSLAEWGRKHLHRCRRLPGRLCGGNSGHLVPDDAGRPVVGGGRRRQAATLSCLTALRLADVHLPRQTQVLQGLAQFCCHVLRLFRSDAGRQFNFHADVLAALQLGQ